MAIFISVWVGIFMRNLVDLRRIPFPEIDDETLSYKGVHDMHRDKVNGKSSNNIIC